MYNVVALLTLIESHMSDGFNCVAKCYFKILPLHVNVKLLQDNTIGIDGIDPECDPSLLHTGPQQ